VEEALWYLGRISPLPEPKYRTVHEEDWANAWKAHYHPIAIGRQLMIVPAWLESPEPKRIPIRMDPGMAFGTGTHPTTQLCLELIEEASQTQEITNVMDVGCGSGILSVAALKLSAALKPEGTAQNFSAAHALGVDIDPRAVEVSLENATLNGVADRYEAGTGSVPEILRGDFSIRQAPLVLANILAPILIRLFDAGLGDLVTPDGVLILSGILDHQADSVIEAAQARGFHLAARKQVADWVALSVRR
jgi:ribosomal protein L11 methyltransferase